MRKFFVVLLTLLLVVQVGTVSAAAAGDSNYTYTVRVYAGNRGSIAGAPVWEMSGLSYGQTVNFNLGGVVVNDNRYYVQGIRYSGHDNDALQSNQIRVTEDMDYVVAYGIRGNLVAYTVNYVTAAGAALAPSQTYYGNVGEKPVVAFLYIDGYTPQAYNLTKTLSANEADNELTFVYTPLVTVVQQTQNAGNANTNAVGNANANAAGDGNAAANANAAAGNADNADNNAQNAADNNAQADNNQDNTVPEVQAPLQNIEDNEAPLSEGPAEILDLDDEDTPLANYENASMNRGSNSSSGNFAKSVIVMCAAAAGLIVLLFVLIPFLKRRKEEREEAQEA